MAKYIWKYWKLDMSERQWSYPHLIAEGKPQNTLCGQNIGRNPVEINPHLPDVEPPCPNCEREFENVERVSNTLSKKMQFSIPPISKQRVIELVERIHPLVEKHGQLWHIAPCDPWTRAFAWAPTLRHQALNLVPSICFPTLHAYGAPVFFKPSIAEVLAQIPEEIIDDVDAFSVEGPEDAADLNKNIDALNAGFHVATTTLYKKATHV